jgi:hypothetical protein
VPKHSAAERLIEELTRERDQARRERALALRDPRADGEGRCFVCHKRRDEVEVMLTAPRPYFRLFICDGCIDRMGEMVAEGRRRKNVVGSR